MAATRGASMAATRGASTCSPASSCGSSAVPFLLQLFTVALLLSQTATAVTVHTSTHSSSGGSRMLLQAIGNATCNETIPSCLHCETALGSSTCRVCRPRYRPTLNDTHCGKQA
jgi:hypothetical protein